MNRGYRFFQDFFNNDKNYVMRLVWPKDPPSTPCTSQRGSRLEEKLALGNIGEWDMQNALKGGQHNELPSKYEPTTKEGGHQEWIKRCGIKN